MRHALGLVGLSVLTALGPVPVSGQTLVTEQSLAARGAPRLAAKDIEARYIGNTLSGKTAEGVVFHVLVEKGGTYRMQFQGKRTADKWHLGRSGEFCAAAGAEVTCTREYDDAGTVYSFTTDGELAGTATIRPGNPEGL